MYHGDVDIGLPCTAVGPDDLHQSHRGFVCVLHGFYQPQHQCGTNLPASEELFPDAHQCWWDQKQVGYQADTDVALAGESVQVREFCSMSIF